MESQKRGVQPVEINLQEIAWEGIERSRCGFAADAQQPVPPWRKRTKGARRARVQTLHAETQQRAGSRKLSKHLQANSSAIGWYNARRCRYWASVALTSPVAAQPMTTDRQPSHVVASNLRACQCDVAPPAQGRLGDLTALWTVAGW
jgi:hypothetical protein